MTRNEGNCWRWICKIKGIDYFIKLRSSDGKKIVFKETQRMICTVRRESSQVKKIWIVEDLTTSSLLAVLPSKNVDETAACQSNMDHWGQDIYKEDPEEQPKESCHSRGTVWVPGDWRHWEMTNYAWPRPEQIQAVHRCWKQQIEL